MVEWRYFLGCKGKSLTDADLVRTYSFANAFIDKWQNATIILKVGDLPWLGQSLPTMFDARTMASVVYYNDIFTRL
jgi:hypothetical protein